MSKPINAAYRSGKVKTWLKTKNSKAAACACGGRLVAKMRMMPQCSYMPRLSVGKRTDNILHKTD